MGHPSLVRDQKAVGRVIGSASNSNAGSEFCQADLPGSLKWVAIDIDYEGLPLAVLPP